MPTQFYPGIAVLVLDESAPMKGKLAKKWKGPYELVERLSDSRWRARRSGSRRLGRRPVHIFHENQL